MTHRGQHGARRPATKFGHMQKKLGQRRPAPTMPPRTGGKRSGGK